MAKLQLTMDARHEKTFNGATLDQIAVLAALVIRTHRRPDEAGQRFHEMLHTHINDDERELFARFKLRRKALTVIRAPWRRRRTITQLRHTAIHEAGHAVIGRVLGLRCGKSTIVANFKEGSNGYTVQCGLSETMSDWEDRGRFRDESTAAIGYILAAMAGAEAEQTLLEKCAGGDGGDRDEIERMGPLLTSKQLKMMRRHTRRLVKHHADKIEKVAKALLKHETLQARQIDALLRLPKHNPMSPRWPHGEKARAAVVARVANF